MCVVTEKGFRFVVIHLGDLLSVSIQKRKNLYNFCGFLSSVYCILVTYSLHRKHRLNNHKVVVERWLFSEEEDLDVHKVPLIWYCSKFDNTED